MGHSTARWLVVLLLLAAAVRLYDLQAQSLWFDEGWSAYAAAQPSLAQVVEAEPTNPPLYYLLLHFIVMGAGDSVFVLRCFSLLWGLLAVVLSFQLGRRLFNTRAGVWGAFLTAFNPLLWWAAQEARMYTLLAVLVLVAALAFHRLLTRPSRAAWLALWGAELALLYAHNTGPVAALWLNAAALLAWLYLHRAGRKRVPDLRLWFTGQVAVALLWSPWFIARFLLLNEANSAVTAAPVLNLDFFSRLWQAVWVGSWLLVGREPVINGLSAVLFVLALVLIPWRKPAARWLIIHVLVLTGGLIIGLLVLGNEMHGRYLVMIVPLLLVAVGGGVGTRRGLSLQIMMAAVVGLVFGVAVHLNTTNPAYQHDDARGMVQYYADSLTANDTVLAWSYADRYDLWYYWDRLGVTARRVTLPEGADLDTVLPLLPDSGDVALNVWYTQRADYRGMMGCLLGHGTINPPEEFTVYGMSSLLYRSPALGLPVERPVEAVSDVARLVTVGSVPETAADTAVCLRVPIILLQNLKADLKAALVVHNALGWEIARADAVFADAAQRTSSRLPHGSVLTAYLLLRLPVGAPPGAYPLFLRVYDETANPSGYDWSQPDKRPVKDLPLGDWHAVGADWSLVNRQTDLPVPADLPVGDGLRLLSHDQAGGWLRNGDPLRLTLLWQGGGVLPDLTLVGEGWTTAIPPSSPDLGQGALNRMLDWREAVMPADVPAGEAELRLPDGRVIARYTIEVIPALTEAPAFASAVQADFSSVGSLVGFTIDGDAFDRSQPVTVTLVWRAAQPAATSYTVFVQLVSSEGRVIAQSDAVPAQNQRPTTGWRAGEYLVDEHRLSFHADATPGPARLIAGLYDAATGERLPLDDGADFVTLAENILIR